MKGREEYDKEYYDKNREKIKQKKQEYRKEYYNKNKDKVLEYQNQYDKEWYNKNKEKLLEKVNCPICNLVVCKKGLKRHQKGRNCIPI